MLLLLLYGSVHLKTGLHRGCVTKSHEVALCNRLGPLDQSRDIMAWQLAGPIIHELVLEFFQHWIFQGLPKSVFSKTPVFSSLAQILHPPSLPRKNKQRRCYLDVATSRHDEGWPVTLIPQGPPIGNVLIGTCIHWVLVDPGSNFVTTGGTYFVTTGGANFVTTGGANFVTTGGGHKMIRKITQMLINLTDAHYPTQLYFHASGVCFCCMFWMPCGPSRWPNSTEMGLSSLGKKGPWQTHPKPNGCLWATLTLRTGIELPQTIHVAMVFGYLKPR